jgi:peptidoglycan/LPS O-acetylase OafA/YrhL
VVRGLAALAVVVNHWKWFYFGRLAPRIQILTLNRAAIETGRVSAREFAVLRFSRLYPLHLATLLIVTVLLEIYRRQVEENETR